MKSTAKKPQLNVFAPMSLASASAECISCQKCQLFNGCHTPFMKPYVPKGWSGLLLLVGEGPGEDEDERTGEPFTGPAGSLLRDLLRDAGYGPNDVAMVNAVRCRPPDNRTPHMPELRACRPFLLQVLIRLRPRHVIALGVAAGKSLTLNSDLAVGKSRGHTLEIPYEEKKLVAKPVGGGAADLSVLAVPASLGHCTVTYHPSAILHGQPVRDDLVNDLRWPFKPKVERPEWGVPQSDVLAVDTEWGRNMEPTATGIADTKTAWAWEVNKCLPRRSISALIERSKQLWFHSGSDDIDHLVTLFPQISRVVQSALISGAYYRDSLLCFRMVDENRSSYGLENLVTSIFKMDTWKSSTEKLTEITEDSSLWSSVQTLERCSLDAWSCAMLSNYLRSNYPAPPKALVELTHRQAQALHRIKLSGTFVESGALKQLLDGLTREADKWESLTIQQATALGSRLDFRPTNDNHIRELLYGQLELSVVDKTEAGLPAVDKVTLGSLALDLPDGPPKGFLQALKEFNKADKLRDYGRQVFEYSHPCGRRADGRDLRRLGFRINPLGAKTGRRASEKPNSQNLNELIRRVFVSRWPGGLIGNYDYSGLEVVLIAWEAKEEKLLEAFTTGRKYIDVGKWMLGLDIQEGTDEYKLVKAGVLSLNYCKTIPSWAWDLWTKFGIRLDSDYKIHRRRAEEMYWKYFQTFPKIIDYQHRREAELLATGMVHSAAGRVRHLPVPQGVSTPGYSHARNQAVNFPIQSFASDVTGCALLDVEEELCRVQGVDLLAHHLALLEYDRKLLTQTSESAIIAPDYGTTVINEVHDSLVADHHPDTWKQDQELFIETMRASKTLRALVPSFDAKLKVGATLDTYWRSK